MKAARRTCRRTSHRPCRRAFTLIEVLVVVAIIALLVSILIPSLQNAREQAKLTQCMANLSTLGKGARAYLNTERDRFCWGPIYTRGGSLQSNGYPLMRTWYFGGNRGQDSGSLGTGGYYVADSEHDWSPGERPLNKYVYTGAKFAKNETRALRQPGPLRVFECPSDKGVRWNTVVDSQLHEPTPAYLEVGTSFQANESWVYFARDKEAAKCPGRLFDLANRIVLILQKKGASRAVLLYEDPADWAMNTPLPSEYRVRTWHNRFDIHNLLFLDGHAALTRMDYRRNAYRIDENSGTGTWVVRHSTKDN